MNATSQIPRSTIPVLFRALAASLLLLALVTIVALLFGTEETSITRALSDPASLDRLIILHARLPRVALAACAGAGLAAVGAALQALLRNPLAEPYLLGVSGGAALGATVAILAGLTGLTLIGSALVPISAFLGGLGATFAVYAIARVSGPLSGTEILVSGIIVNAMASALVTFAKSFGSAARTQELIFWLMGFVPVVSRTTLVLITLYVLAGVVALFVEARRLNLLSLGDEPAAHLGLDVTALVRRVFLASSLVVGAIVSVTGLIGFVGLVVPHAVRRVVGPDMRILLPISFVAGAATLIAADVVARAAFPWLGTEPPVGAVTALVGGPVALVLLARARRST
jgi:iron complex transport system permease protein